MTSQLVKQVAFLQGEDAQQIFDIMYPVGNRSGNRRTIRLAHDVMIDYISDSNHHQIEPLPSSGYTGYVSTRYFVMQWNYPYNWVALYQKLTKADIAREQELVST